MSLAEVEELMEGLDYSIQPSEGKSLGLFALRPLGPGSVVGFYSGPIAVSYTHLRAHETLMNL
eukprot:87001-Prymnesium_polylepis.1